MNIISVTFGSACCYSRIERSIGNKANNEDYIFLLIISTLIMILLSVLLLLFLKKDGISILDYAIYILLSCAVLWRSYSDIEFRLNLNYTGYFVYFVFISVGYLLGALLLVIFKHWAIALLPGEIAGLFFVIAKGSIFKIKKKIKIYDKYLPEIFTILCTSYFMNSLIFNSDRILLKVTVGGTAVSVYYVSSLFGKTMSLITTPFNSVISGYLAKYKGDITVKFMNITVFILVITAIVAAFLCTLGSYIILPFLYSDLFDNDLCISESKKLSNGLYWRFSSIIVGSIELCKDRVDGIIFLSSFPCGLDSLVNDVVIRKLNCKCLNLVIDDMDAFAGIETRLESFVDIV